MATAFPCCIASRCLTNSNNSLATSTGVGNDKQASTILHRNASHYLVIAGWIRHLQWRMADERPATRARARQSLSRPARCGGCRPPNLPRSLCPLSWQRRGWNQEAAFPEERPRAATGHRWRPPLVAGKRESGPGYAILGQAGRSSDLAGHLLLLCKVVALSLRGPAKSVRRILSAPLGMRIGLAALVLLVAIQLIPVNRSNPNVDPSQTIYATLPMPADVKAVFERSCKNCHSNETSWPWYSYVAPISWVVVRDVPQARKADEFIRMGCLSDKHKDE